MNKSQRRSVQKSRGVLLALELTEPRTAKKIKGWIILCHGLGVSHTDPLIRVLAAQFAREGYRVVRFDFSGHGTSTGGVATRKLSNFISDLKRIIAECRTIDPELPIIVVGHSIGALTALITAAQDKKNITAVVLIACNADAQKIYDRLRARGRIQRFKKYTQVGSVRVAKNFWDDRLRYAPKKHVQQIRIPKLFICGTDDVTNPLADSKQLLQWAPQPKKLVSISAENHFFKTRLGQERVAKAINSWLKTIPLS